MDKSVVSIATIPERYELLMKAIESLYAQADVIDIKLNGYDRVPDGLVGDSKIFTTITDNSLRDGHKFMGLHKYGSAYIFTCDDDLVYPESYVRHSIDWIERLRRSSVVTYHGRSLGFPPFTGYYHKATLAVRCLGNSPYTILVQFPGTGVTAYHTDTLLVPEELFSPEKANVGADVILGCHLNRLRIPVFALAHSAFKYLHPKNTIFDEFSYNDGHIVEYLNENF